MTPHCRLGQAQGCSRKILHGGLPAVSLAADDTVAVCGLPAGGACDFRGRAGHQSRPGRYVYFGRNRLSALVSSALYLAAAGVAHRIGVSDCGRKSTVFQQVFVHTRWLGFHLGVTQFVSFRGAKRREIPQNYVRKTNSQGFLAPFVARNDIRIANWLTPIYRQTVGKWSEIRQTLDSR